MHEIAAIACRLCVRGIADTAPAFCFPTWQFGTRWNQFLLPKDVVLRDWTATIDKRYCDEEINVLVKFCHTCCSKPTVKRFDDGGFELSVTADPKCPDCDGLGLIRCD